MKSTLRVLVAAAALAIAALPALAKDGALALVPSNAVSVGVVKLSDMRTSPLSGILFQHTDKFSADGDAAKFLTDAGLDPAKDVDLLVVATSPRTALGSDADVLVAVEGRFNGERLSNALVARGAVKKNGYLITPEEANDNDHGPGAVAFPTASLALMGTERAVVAALAARANGGTGFPGASNIGHEMARIDTNATAWAIVDVQRAARLAGGAPKIGNDKHAALTAAVKSVSMVAVWATDSGDALKLGAFGLSSDTETLGLLEDTIRGAMATLRLAVKDKAPEMVSVLRKFDVRRNDDSITITGSIPASQLRELVNKKRGAIASAQ